jgi:hypothetical protein
MMNQELLSSSWSVWDSTTQGNVGPKRKTLLPKNDSPSLFDYGLDHDAVTMTATRQSPALQYSFPPGLHPLGSALSSPSPSSTTTDPIEKLGFGSGNRSYTSNNYGYSNQTEMYYPNTQLQSQTQSQYNYVNKNSGLYSYDSMKMQQYKYGMQSNGFDYVPSGTTVDST